LRKVIQFVILMDRKYFQEQRAGLSMPNINAYPQKWTRSLSLTFGPPRLKLCRNCAIASLTNISAATTASNPTTTTLSSGQATAPAPTSTSSSSTSSLAVASTATLEAAANVSVPAVTKSEIRPRPQSLSNPRTAASTGGIIPGPTDPKSDIPHNVKEAQFINAESTGRKRDKESPGSQTTFIVSAQVHQSSELPSPQLMVSSSGKKRLSPVIEISQGESGSATPQPHRHQVVTFQKSNDEDEEDDGKSDASSAAQGQFCLQPPPAGRDWRKLLQSFRRLKIAQSNKEAVLDKQSSHKSQGKILQRGLLVPQNSLDDLNISLTSKKRADQCTPRVMGKDYETLTKSPRRGWLTHQASLDDSSSVVNMKFKKGLLAPQRSLDIENYSHRESASLLSHTPKASLDDVLTSKCRHPIQFSSQDKLHGGATSKKSLWHSKTLKSLMQHKSLDFSSGHEEGHCEIIRHSENTGKSSSLQGSLGSLVGEGKRNKPLLVPQNSIEVLTDPKRPTPTALRRSRLVPQHSLDTLTRRRGFLKHQYSLDHIELPCPSSLPMKQNQSGHPLTKKSQIAADEFAEKQQSVESLIAFYSGHPYGKEEVKEAPGFSQKSLKTIPAPLAKPELKRSKGDLFDLKSAQHAHMSALEVNSLVTPPVQSHDQEEGALPLLQAASAQLQFLQAARAEMNPAQAARAELLLLQAARAELEFLKAAQEKLEYLRATRNRLQSAQACAVTFF
jgi:hypothetical protein